MMIRVFGIVAAAIVCAVTARTQNDPLREMFDHHRWFELRDATAGRNASPLYRGAVAAAFNLGIEAESHLRRAIRDAATPAAANEAREILLNLYMRLGRSAEMLRLIDEALAADSSRDDIRNARTAFDALRGAPNTIAKVDKRAPFSCSISPNGIVLPARINGHDVQWLMDTAFSHAAMSASEARRLGVAIKGAEAKAGDFAGGTTAMRVGRVDRLAIGNSEVRSVPVLVFPDSQPPFNEYPPGRQGAIGLPVIAALDGISWTKEGTCQLGSTARRRAGLDSNLAFDDSTPIARASVNGKHIDVVIDTGNQGGTQLWDRFAGDFPDVMARGTKTTRSVRQIGGSSDRDVVAVSALILRIGGFDATLRPAYIFKMPVGDDVHHGNVGVDVLTQASAVSIDFGAMSLVLR